MPRRRKLTAVPGQPKRVVAYRRVSELAGRGGDDFYSPDIQLDGIRRMIRPAGLQEVAVIDDIDETGRDFAREGIDRIRRMAADGHIDAIAVYKIDRFGRNVLESLQVLAELAAKGVTIMSASEQIDTSTPSGRWMLTNLLSLAEMQSDEIGRGWSGAIARRAETGKHHGRPLGYLKRDKMLTPDPDLAPAITEVFRRYAAGEPIGEITEYLATMRGVAMHTPNVKKLLRNAAYRGMVVAGGEELPGEHDALVDDDTWARVQERLDAEAGTPPRALAATWSLVGLVVCPRGHRLQRQGERLVCGQGRGDVKGGDCPGVGRPLLARVEQEVLDQVADYAARLRTDAEARAVRLSKRAAARVDRARLEREVADARAAMVKLATRNALDQLPDEVYQEALADLRRTERTAAAELARLPAEAKVPDPEQEAAMVEKFLALWPKMTFAERGRSLRSVVSHVKVRPAEVWRQPEEKRVTVHFHW
ncbi:DNA invertase Pin-like site-specific DNA recombinase [Micromonospora sp. M71_S20]|uniref:recombinase family protein n=1 Tax=Micromonospora sp. M71_S20 TaxID=592872 RepID=UPI000EAF7C69|nr:recombinase family protein [Micromonospora sp. M71_S20]RLK13288.1 DNA invertase Pin-like site-specific DNA recombinase [Micromonospora sp. M71_S20]